MLATKLKSLDPQQDLGFESELWRTITSPECVKLLRGFRVLLIEASDKESFVGT